MLPAETTTTGRIAAAVQIRFRQPSFAGADGCGENALDAGAHRARPCHFQARRRPPDVLHEIEQDLRVGQPVVDHFERAGVADDFGKLGQPGELPPRETD